MMRKMLPQAKAARLASQAVTRGLASQPKIVWTYTDEAPALATFALLPVVHATLTVLKQTREYFD